MTAITWDTTSYPAKVKMVHYVREGARVVGSADMAGDWWIEIPNATLESSPDYRYEPARDANFIKKKPIMGAPSFARMGTSGVERYNLTARHVVGRTRRLCLAFSKTLRGHKAGVALGVAAYNLTRIHSTIRVTPAMEAGVTDHVWDVAELVDAALAAKDEPKPVAQVLVPRAGTGPARALPGGRGFLRLVQGGGTPVPQVPPGPQPEAPALPAPAAPREPVQLSLFDE